MGAYGDKIKADYVARNLTPDQIYANKCANTKARNAIRREVIRFRANNLLAKWQALTPKQQLNALDKRLGVGVGAKKQRRRIAERIN